MIPVEHEDVEGLKKWGMGLSQMLESCALCNTPTRYWHTNSNTPCCQDCAEKHSVEELKKTPAYFPFKKAAMAEPAPKEAP